MEKEPRPTSCAEQEPPFDVSGGIEMLRTAKVGSVPGEIALKLIDAGEMDAVANYLSRFLGLNEETAIRLIDAGEGGAVASRLSNFSNLGEKTAYKLIDVGKGGAVAEYLSSFSGLDHSTVANKLIDVGKGGTVASRLSNFSNLGEETAYKLIDVGEGGVVAKYLSSFSGLDHSAVANKLIDVGEGGVVAFRLSKFSGLGEETAYKLIDAGEASAVIACVSKFSEPYHNTIADKLIDAGKGGAVAEYLSSFSGLGEEIALKLIDAGEMDAVARYLSRFSGLGEKTAYKLIDVGKGGAVAEYLSSFSGLGEEIALKLIDAGQWREVYHRLDSFSQLSLSVLLAYWRQGDNSSQDTQRIIEKIPDLPPNLRAILDEEGLLGTAITHKEFAALGEERILSITKEALLKNPGVYRAQAWRSESFLEEHDNDAFETSAAIFGAEQSVTWWGTADTNQLHIVISNVIRLFERSETNPQYFMEHMLRHQKNDATASVVDFNAMIESVNLDYRSVVERARNSKVHDIRAFAEYFESAHPFQGWNTFKRYCEFNNLLAEEEVLEQLEGLRAEGEHDPEKANRYRFFKMLAFHKDSKVSMEKVLELLNNPEAFLDIGDEHSETSTERKKPANYTQFPHLDLTAEDLRDALTDGVIDKIAFFPPASRTIEVADSAFPDKALSEYLLQSLGSREEGNPNRPLFNALFGKEGALKQLGVNINQFKELQQLTPEARRAIESLFGKHNFKDPREKRTYTVTVFPPSDPRGHLAGNDTACCMPFGSGKNNVYTFNPTCAQLVVQEKRGDALRTVAQSVLTPDIDVQHSVPDLLNAIESDRGQLHETVSDNVAGNHEIFVTADNIEIAPNAREQAAFIENAYRAFLVDYKDLIETQGGAPKINGDFAVVGTGYSDAFNYLPTVDNTFVPVCPPSYSDNTGDKSYVLSYEKQGVVSESDWSMREIQPGAEGATLPKGIAELKPRDSLAVSYIEGKVYADNESLMQYIHRMSNEIIAASIKNTQDGRPNLMMKAVSNDGDMLGYILAYEGVLDKKEDVPQRAIYISDLAVDRQASQLAGGRLIKTFVDRVGEEYLAKDDAIPVVFEARDKTSYQIVQKHLDSLGRNYGYAFTAEEIDSYYNGDDLMHVMVLRPEKKN